MRQPGFFAELKRRHVYRAGVIYAMTAWLLIQIATQTFPFFNVPNWVVRLIIVALVLGFPVVLGLSWAFEWTPQGLVKADELPPQSPTQRRTRRYIDRSIIALLLVVIVLLILHQRGVFHLPNEKREKSIAVLPFENFSAQKENAFFADGIQDSLLTSLAKIKDLKVISRTSVMRYRDAGARNIKEIGDSLGVANILEGSVRREGDTVAVNVQLIDAQNDRHLWANRYESTVGNSLGIEGQLATQIADELRATLTPEEKIRVTRKPTENADALALYLHAVTFEQGPDTLLLDYRRAEQLYEKAIALDPKFALAHARLASTCAEIFHFHEPTPAWEKKAKSEAKIAIDLEPNLSEAHFALGLCFFWMDSDYERAAAEFAGAQELAPNDSNIVMLRASIQRRQGRWDEALAAFEAAEKVDPQNPNIVRNLLITHTAMRQWPAGARDAERWAALAPDSVVARVQSGYIEFWWKGDTARLHAELAKISSPNDPDGVATACRWETAMLDGDYAAAPRVLQNSAGDTVDYLNGSATPKSFLVGCSAMAAGDAESAKAQFEQTRIAFEKDVQEAPESSQRHANLGLLYAFLGRKDDAIREATRATELKPESQDAFDGVLLQGFLALVYARTGENDRAFPLLARLLHTPGAVDSANYSITRRDLERRWEWAPLRKDPRFANLFPPPTPTPKSAPR